MASLLSYKCLMLFFIPICSGCPHWQKMEPPQKPTLEICVMKYKAKIRFNIRNLFPKSNETWLSVGFPEATQKENYIPFFLLKVEQSNLAIVEQTDKVKKDVSCSMPEKGKIKLISVDCNFGKSMSKYAYSKKIKIFWNTGISNTVNIEKEGEHLLKNHSTLNADLNQNQNSPDKNAGLTAMRLLRNYGKSMGVIFGISFLLTALITVIICCCCKKKTPLGPSRQKLSKDASVSFYRDNSEADGQSDESDDDEKVAFIRNNNTRNSSV